MKCVISFWSSFPLFLSRLPFEPPSCFASLLHLELASIFTGSRRWRRHTGTRRDSQTDGQQRKRWRRERERAGGRGRMGGERVSEM